MPVECSNELVSKTQQVIKNHLNDSHFSLNDLCLKIGYSYSHLHHVIKSETGMTLAHLVREERLSVAEKLLLQSQMNVSEISFAVGFKDPNYFTRVFRLKNGIAPREWREQNK